MADLKIDLKTVEDLTNAFGPSGFEEEVVSAIKKHSEGLFLRNDAMHNVYAYLSEEELKNSEERLRSGRPVFMLDAHSDEVGFMVQNIEENGLLDIICLGGIHNTNIPAHSVIVRTETGKKIRGITTSKPIHFLTAAQRADDSLEIESIRIDVGASSRQEVMEDYGISVGDPVMPDVKFEYDEEHGICYGKAFDNRLGCVSILETMKRLIGEKLCVDVVGAFASQEEVGTRGAKVTAQEVLPDLAIVFEGSPADDFYFRAGIAQCSLKAGTQIRHMDSSYVSSPAFMKYAHEIGKKYGIKYQDAVRRGGGTDAGVISLTGKAVPTLVLGIPSRYVHTHYNFCAAEDIEATVSMAAEVIKNLDEERINALLHKGEI